MIESGAQVIGKDKAEAVIRSWVFQSDGGFGGGVGTAKEKWSAEATASRRTGGN